MKALLALGLITLCIWGASQLPDGPLVCQTARGLTLSFKASLVLGAIAIFLAGGQKRISLPEAFVWTGLAALLLFGLDALHILTPFGNCG